MYFYQTALGILLLYEEKAFCSSQCIRVCYKQYQMSPAVLLHAMGNCTQICILKDMCQT